MAKPKCSTNKQQMLKQKLKHKSMTITTMTHYAWVIGSVAAISLPATFYWKHSGWVKDQIANVRRHWKLFTFTAFVTITLIYTFNANYTFQNPIVARSAESYMQVWNERAVCLQSLDDYQKAQQTAGLH